MNSTPPDNTSGKAGSPFHQDHGGDVHQGGSTPVISDFSASINPLGHPDGLIEAVRDDWKLILHYPDRASRALIDAIADKHELESERLIAGNGSAELIDVALRAAGAKRLILCPPDFGLYWKLAPRDIEIVEIPRIEGNGFALDHERLLGALREGDLVLFSNPATPSGHLEPAAEVKALAERASSRGAKLFVDEAFMDFSPAESVLSLAGRSHTLSVFRSMTKFYGVPGVRLGFMSTHPDMVARMDRLRPPWSVSTVAQSVGVQCLYDKTWDDKSRSYLVRAREKLAGELSRIPGVTVLPSAANYLLLKLDPPAPDADHLYTALRAKGTLIRHCASFGLGNRYVRVAVRTMGENADLVSSIQQIAAGSKAP